MVSKTEGVWEWLVDNLQCLLTELSLEGWEGSRGERNNFLNKVISNLSYVGKGRLIGRRPLVFFTHPHCCLCFLFKNSKRA